MKRYIIELPDGNYIGFNSIEKAQIYALQFYLEHWVDYQRKTNDKVIDLEEVLEDVKTIFETDCIDDYLYIHEVEFPEE